MAPEWGSLFISWWNTLTCYFWFMCHNVFCEGLTWLLRSVFTAELCSSSDNSTVEDSVRVYHMFLTFRGDDNTFDNWCPSAGDPTECRYKSRWSWRKDYTISLKYACQVQSKEIICLKEYKSWYTFFENLKFFSTFKHHDCLTPIVFSNPSACYVAVLLTI